MSPSARFFFLRQRELASFPQYGLYFVSTITLPAPLLAVISTLLAALS